MKYLLFLVVLGLQAGSSWAHDSFKKDSFKSALIHSQVFPKEVISILRKHPEWLTHAYSKRSNTQGLVILTPYESKKWALEIQEGRLCGLKEKLKTSVLSLEDSGKAQYHIGSALVRWEDPVSLKSFFYEATRRVGEERVQFRILGESRFEIQSESSEDRVVFFPAPQEETNASNWIRPDLDRKKLGVRLAPLGGQERSIEDDLGLLVPVSQLIHHDLSRKAEVYLDRNFPQSIIPTVQVALAKWNQAIGAPYFRLNDTRVDWDESDCISKKLYCITWRGGETPAWTGLVGNSMLSYDPESGIALGGVISIENTAISSRLTKTPREEDQKLIRRDFDLAWIVSVFTRVTEFKGYVHPMPQLAIENHFLHEIGHLMGFEHNFHGSLKGTAQSPSLTVMDYLPFSARRDAELGPYDLALLRVVYQGQKMDPGFQFCGDRESTGRGNQPRDPGCNPLTIGNPVDWYILVGKHAPQGVFSRVPRDLKQSRVIDHLAELLADKKSTSPSEREKIQVYLCSLTRVRAKLREELGSLLNCLEDDDADAELILNRGWVNSID